MAFLVTARKYRPAAFKEVVAQGHVVNTLMNSIRMGRIAHAYLFTGPRGVGKTTTARIFAKALNCPNAVESEPCNTCDTCVEIAEGRCIDVIEIDGASNNGVEQVRTLLESVRYMPVREKYKMYIIDEVHMLTTNAFNALLKTLEEPPPHAIFIFATTEPHKVPATVISRCQRYDFKRIPLQDIVGQLGEICAKEEISFDEQALFVIARKAEGSMRDAESILDQVVGFSGGAITADAVRDVLHTVDEELFFAVTDAVLAKEAGKAFEIAERIVKSGHDVAEFLFGLEEHFRNILVVRSTGNPGLVETGEETRSRYTELSAQFSDGDLLRLMKLTSDASASVKYTTQHRIKLELALVAMMKMDTTVEIDELLSRLGTMRSSGGNFALSPAAKAVAASASEPARSYQPAPPPAERRIPPEDTGGPRSLAASHAGLPSGVGMPGELPPPHPLVQLLINGLDAEILPDTK